MSEHFTLRYWVPVDVTLPKEIWLQLDSAMRTRWELTDDYPMGSAELLFQADLDGFIDLPEEADYREDFSLPDDITHTSLE